MEAPCQGPALEQGLALGDIEVDWLQALGHNASRGRSGSPETELEQLETELQNSWRKQNEKYVKKICKSASIRDLQKMHFRTLQTSKKIEVAAKCLHHCVGHH